MKITVVGLGYIGLPTAVALSAIGGHEVVGCDTDLSVIDTLERGFSHIKEPGLQELYSLVHGTDKFKVKAKPEESDVFIICVPTPARSCMTKVMANLVYVAEAARAVGKVLKAGDLVILESTVPPGTTSGEFSDILREVSGRRDFHVAYCPERAMPGSTMLDITKNDRVIGSETIVGLEVTRKVYSTFCTGQLWLTTPEIAEMAKLAENAYRDVNIAYANELEAICDELGIDGRKVIELANKHPRVNILSPGAGVGGHCIPVDPWFIFQKAPEKANIIRIAREINDDKPQYIADEITRRLDGNFESIIAIFGLSYKKDTDDTRNSPSMKMAKCLSTYGFSVICSEPNIQKKNINKILNFEPFEAIALADYIVYAQDHECFDERVKDAITSKPYYDCTGALI